MRRFFLLLPFLFLLASCTQVPRADYRQTPDIPADAHPAPIMFSHYKLDLPAGQPVGLLSRGSRMCGWPHEPVSRHYLRKALDAELIREAFNDTLESQGYDVVGNRTVMFDEIEDYMRGEFKISARITAVQIDACEQEPGVLLWLLTSRSGVEGEMYIAVDWTVYDALGRRVAYRTRTEGYGRRSSPNEEGIALLTADAFEMAAHNLGADPAFRDLIVFGRKPREHVAADDEDDRTDRRPRTFDPREAVMLPDRPLSRVPFENKAETARHAALMIETGMGHGSGFFITAQGHILTSQHVVGRARHVRVSAPGYPAALTAEVLRSSRRGDVALLRLVDRPSDLSIVTLPIRRDWPAVSETVFAIGAPLDRSLQNTVTRGIVSAHRRAFTGSRRQDRLQADVEIHGGNSGGPLTDAHGNIVAISAEGYGDPGIGLNLFIPVGAALADLDITIVGDNPAAAKPLPLYTQN